MRYLRKDITTVEAPALIAHGVNCKRKMGSGVAKALYEKWESVRKVYLISGSMELGDAQFVQVEPGVIVANCFTQRNYGRDGDVYAAPEAIKNSLTKVVEFALTNLNLDEVHMPKIGCGLGGLDWKEDVLPVLLEIEENYTVSFTVCEL